MAHVFKFAGARRRVWRDGCINPQVINLLARSLLREMRRGIHVTDLRATKILPISVPFYRVPSTQRDTRDEFVRPSDYQSPRPIIGLGLR